MPASFVDRDHFGRPGTIALGGDDLLLHIRGQTVEHFRREIGKLNRLRISMPRVADVFLIPDVADERPGSSIQRRRSLGQ